MERRSFRLVALLLVVLVAVPVAGTPAPVAGAAGGIDQALEQALPPAARHLLAAVRVFKGLSARNRVYREAKQVQRDLRSYYDARIDTAQQMLLDRQHLGLAGTQVAAYGKVKTMLEAERDLALQLTENEKRAAKYAFEGKLRRELFGALLRTPKAQTALKGVRETLQDVRDGFGKLQTALEGGNPVAIFVEDLQDKVDKIRAAGQVMSMLSGSAGAGIIAKADAVQAIINDANSATALASEANGEVVSALDGAIETLGSHITTKRRPRAAGDVLTGLLVDELAERIFTPGGEVPVEDIVADVIARGFDPNLVRNIGVALGEIDPALLATMRERVRAQLLADKLERIAEICGRASGSGHAQAVAALDGESPVPEPTLCALFRNPEALQRFITKMTQRPETTPSDAEPAEELEPVRRHFVGEGIWDHRKWDQKDRSCSIELTVGVELTLEPDGTAALFLEDTVWDRYEGDELVCFANGAAQLFAGTWVPVSESATTASIVYGSAGFEFEVPVSGEMPSGTAAATVPNAGNNWQTVLAFDLGEVK